MKIKMGIDIGLEDAKGNPIQYGDWIKVEVRRLSSSHSTWYKKRNINHGSYYIGARIQYAGASFVPEFNKEHIEELKQPIGKEKDLQVVWTPHPGMDCWWSTCEVLQAPLKEPHAK